MSRLVVVTLMSALDPARRSADVARSRRPAKRRHERRRAAAHFHLSRNRRRGRERLRYRRLHGRVPGLRGRNSCRRVAAAAGRRRLDPDWLRRERFQGLDTQWRDHKKLRRMAVFVHVRDRWCAGNGQLADDLEPGSTGVHTIRFGGVPAGRPARWRRVGDGCLHARFDDLPRRGPCRGHYDGERR